MPNSNLLAGLALALMITFVSAPAQGQETAQEPELKLKPSAVVQQPDGKSLIEKASRLIGFRFMSSAKSQPGVNMDELVRGMAAAHDDEDMTSFIAGYEMMKRLKSGGAEISMDDVVAGMKMANDAKELDMSEQEVMMLQKAYTKLMEENRIAKLKKVADENLAKGEAYLAAQRKKNPNLKELENGMYFEVLSEGSGDSPKATDRVKIDYTGRFIDGKVFDSSVNPPDGRPPSPATFGVSEVVPGFTKALLGMKKGSKWRVYIPGPMAYGVKGRGSIGPNQMLIFEIELLELISQ